MKLKRLLCTAITLTILLGSIVAAESIKPTNIETPIAMHSGLEQIAPLEYQIVVEGKTVALPKGVVPALRGKSDVLIPLRAVGEALNYDITWQPDRKAAHLEMSIASMEFPVGQSTYYRKGKLQIINLDMDYPMDDAPVLINGVTYVPAKIFEEFLNDVTVDAGNRIVTIEVRKAQLAGTTGVM
ncbi:stalk domain-containing protein [Veillonella agrestimuris]|uniref:stalk domain-containing protein n=1 Tax=Veillonella agrestimuris TaxID=2941340 RepID=UPI00203F0A40|nr:stalk domain-containing protein [Veillonella agrestimuris]